MFFSLIIQFFALFDEVIWLRGLLSILGVSIDLYLIIAAKKIIWSDYKEEALNKIYSEFHQIIDYINEIIMHPELYEIEGHYPNRLPEIPSAHRIRNKHRPYRLMYNKIKSLEAYQHLYLVQNDTTIDRYMKKAIAVGNKILAILYVAEEEKDQALIVKHDPHLEPLIQELKAIIQQFKQYLDKQAE